MQLVLLCNNFIFDNENYIQVKGTAMGTRAAPNYANLFMGDFEERFIYNTEWNTYLQYFGRYIDDLFMIWNGSEASLLEFVAYLNSVHETIKFTFKYSASQLEFLDVLVIKDSKGYLSTDVYQKDTDTHSYLHCHSAHPKHCKKSILYSQFLRLKRICSEKDTLKNEYSNLQNISLTVVTQERASKEQLIMCYITTSAQKTISRITTTTVNTD